LPTELVDASVLRWGGSRIDVPNARGVLEHRDGGAGVDCLEETLK
jgi:hypothetical protein